MVYRYDNYIAKEIPYTKMPIRTRIVKLFK